MATAVRPVDPDPDKGLVGACRGPEAEVGSWIFNYSNFLRKKYENC